MIERLFPAALLGYALGAVPTGVLITRLCGAPDVRTVGSGHTGGTNVVRAAGRVWAGVLTGLVDLGLGAAAALLARALWPTEVWPRAVGGAAAVVGHNWSAYIRLRGGVGLSTLTGMLLAQVPAVALPSLALALPLWLLLRRLLHHDARGTALVMLAVPGILALWGAAPEVLVGGTAGALAVMAAALRDWNRRYAPHEGVLAQFRLRRSRVADQAAQAAEQPRPSSPAT